MLIFICMINIYFFINLITHFPIKWQFVIKTALFYQHQQLKVRERNGTNKRAEKSICYELAKRMWVFFSLLKRKTTKKINENMKANVETLYVVINNMLL